MVFEQWTTNVTTLKIGVGAVSCQFTLVQVEMMKLWAFPPGAEPVGALLCTAAGAIKKPQVTAWRSAEAHL